MTDETIVGVRHGATREEIERAYRKRALLVHPDRGGTAEAFRALVAARDRLLAAAPGAGEPQECPECHGRRKIRTVNGFNMIDMMCQRCQGQGVLS